jgi:hypothetical protein
MSYPGHPLFGKILYQSEARMNAKTQPSKTPYLDVSTWGKIPAGRKLKA